MTGAIAQLQNRGPQDMLLTGNPEITFFRQITKRHTEFAVESIQQQFSGPVNFGTKASCTLAKQGDLVWSVFVQVQLPDLTGYGLPNLRWCNNAPLALLQSVELDIAGTRIDRHVPVFLDCWSELEEKEEKRAGYNAMIGKRDDWSTATASARGGTYYVPLKFFFCRFPNMSLPLIALLGQDVHLNFEFAPWEQLVRNSAPVATLSPTPPQLVDCKVWVDYVFLGELERRIYALKPHDMVIEQLQYKGDESVYQPLADANAGIPGAAPITRKLQLAFSHPVRELIWVYTAYANYQTNAQSGNNIFDYNVPDHQFQWANGTNALVSETVANVAALDPFDSCKLMINGSDRFAERSGVYHRLVQPYQYHTRCPTKKVYVYSLALWPERDYPTGSMNFSRIQSAELQLTLNQFVTSGKISVFARSHNVLHIAQGQAALAFAS